MAQIVAGSNPGLGQLATGKLGPAFHVLCRRYVGLLPALPYGHKAMENLYLYPVTCTNIKSCGIAYVKRNIPKEFHYPDIFYYYYLKFNVEIKFKK